MKGCNATRRRLLIGTAGAVGAAGLDAVALEPNWLDVALHDVAVPGLPRALEGFGIAQITDAHLRALGRVEAAIVRAVRENDVDLVVLTGDIVDSHAGLPVLRDLLSELRRYARSSVATLGNWEHWGKVASAELGDAYAEHGTRLLVNDAVDLPDGVRIVATDDSTAGEPRLDKIAGSVGGVTILLTHSPVLLDRTDIGARQISLALAGHTHGGQVRLSAASVPFVPEGSGRFVAGWYDIEGVPAYISRGTGTSIAPVRFMCRPELPIFRLRQG